jgi:5-methylcytosine-specific restriction endonuclease McrA
MVWSREITEQQPLQPDEIQCICGRAFLRYGRRLSCSDSCTELRKRKGKPKKPKTERQRELQRQRDRRRPTRTQAGYGSEHTRERKRQLKELEASGSAICEICHRLMTVDMKLDLDHVFPLGLGGDNEYRRLVHSSCNRSRGTRTRTKLAGGLRKKPEPEWQPQIW